MRSAKVIWYVHPYAGGPGIGRYDRPFHLSKHWNAEGVKSVVITPSFHHLLDAEFTRGKARFSEVCYEFLACPTYQGNRLGRLVNMAWFAVMLIISTPRLVRRYGKPSLIIASSPHPYMFPSTHLLARLLGARSVFEVRDLWPLSLVELANLSPLNWLVKITGWIERFAYKRADYVVSLLPCTLEYMEKLGLDEGRWRYIPNGVEPEGNNDSSSDEACVNLAKSWQIEGRTVIVYAGALGVPNAVESLVEGLGRVPAQQRRKLGVIIVGRGERQAFIRKLISDCQLSESAAVFEQVPKTTIQSLLKLATAGYISLRPQPLFRFGVSPNKLFDYMLASIPVIYAIKSGNDPVAEAGCGLSVDPANPGEIAGALMQLCSLSEAARAEMGARGRSYVLEKHRYKNLALEYIRLIVG